MVVRCDYYSDEEYELAQQLEREEFEEAVAKEEYERELAEIAYQEEQIIQKISNLAGDYKCYDERLSHNEALILCNMLTELQHYRNLSRERETRNVEKEFDLEDLPFC